VVFSCLDLNHDESSQRSIYGDSPIGYLILRYMPVEDLVLSIWYNDEARKKLYSQVGKFHSAWYDQNIEAEVRAGLNISSGSAAGTL
jgi:hypothetical protein